jgi:hypothetical protein
LSNKRSHYTPEKIAKRLSSNRAKLCKAPGCNNRRHNFGTLCKYHAQNAQRFGWYAGRRIMPREYALERRHILELAVAHSDHPGIQAGLGFFQEWIAAAVTHGHVIARADILRLSDAGIAPLGMLAEAAAVWLLAVNRPGLVPMGKPLDYALGIAVLSLAPLSRSTVPSGNTTKVRYKPISGPSRRDAGVYIRENVGPLLINIAEAIRAKEEIAKQRKLDLSHPIAESTQHQPEDPV